MVNKNLPEVKIVSITEFLNSTIYLVEHEGKKYLPLKPLIDLIGLHWKSIKTTLSQDDYINLYGLKELKPPKIDGLGSASTPQRSNIFMRFDRVQIFICRLSIKQIRSQGKPKVADYILTLINEWADVLHKYEQGEVISKHQRTNDLKELKQLYDLQKFATDQTEKQTLGLLIKQKLTELAGKLDEYQDPQQEINL